MIKNWELFLESENSDLNLIKDILTELEDTYGIIISYDDREDPEFFALIQVLSTNKIDKNKNCQFVRDLDLLINKIIDMTGMHCEYRCNFIDKNLLSTREITQYREDTCGNLNGSSFEGAFIWVYNRDIEI